MTTAIAVAATFLVSLAAPLIFWPLLHRLGVVDVPNERSSHSRPTVRGVGLAPLVGILIGYGILLTSEGTGSRELLFVLLAVPVAAGVLGLVEDTRGLAVRMRAGAQLLLGLGGAAAIIALADASWWLLPVFAIAIAGYINVANFMDGVDGISGMHGAVVGAAYSVVGVITGESWLVSAGMILSLAFVAFLPWNLLRGGMFLGDVGSYLLGGAVASIAVAAYVSGAPLAAVVGPVTVYLADTGVTLVRRIMRRERWLESHRSHLYQRLCDLGVSHVQVATVVAAATALTSAFGLLSLGSSPIGTLGAVAGILLVIAGYSALPRFLRGRNGPSETVERQKYLPESDLPDGAATGQGAWAVVGASGFIGSALMREIRDRGIEVIGVTAPRLVLDHESVPATVLEKLEDHSDEIDALRRRLSGVSVVVNAAGLAAPDSTVNEALFGANALLPVVIARAAERAGAARYLHLSSAAVQGRRDVLDESAATNPFSPYSRAKALGEASLLEYLREFDTSATPEVVIVRATSVQGPGRSTTDQLRRVATSPFASVARPGDRPSVVSSLRGLIEFVATVGTRAESVPTIVLQPWEGLTTSAVLEHAGGGRRPIMLPLFLCRAAIAAGYAVGSVLTPVKGIVRRVELMWMGQAQDALWATSVAADRNSYVADLLNQRDVETRAR